MTKNFIKIAFMAIAMATAPMAANAQADILGGLKNILTKTSGTTAADSTVSKPANSSAATASAGSILSGVLGGLTGKSDKVNEITNIVGNLLGTSKIKESTLIGSWKYTQPCVAFESEDILSKVGGAAASEKIQKKLNTALTKAGIKPGKMTITFNEDKTFAFNIGNKSQGGTYAIDGTDVVFTFKNGKTARANVKYDALNKKIQLAMKADKLLDVVSTIATKASAYSSQMATVSSLLSNYKGMYLGLEFQK